MNEDALIGKYFHFDVASPYLIQGPGDDAALIKFPDKPCAISTDLFLQGAHFDPDAKPQDAGYKALAVNLSDLAAMGATPVCFTLALAMPDIDESWIAGFSAGMHALAQEHGIALIGGDLSRGELAVCLTIIGSLDGEAPALRRDAAQIGDTVCVSGTLGDAAMARRYPEREDLEFCRSRLHRPTPRVALGQQLRGHAHAAIDVSDGLLLDLSRLLRQSQKGAHLRLESIPLSPAVASDREQGCDWGDILRGGEDYELIFTAPPSAMNRIHDMALQCEVTITEIGQVETEEGLRLSDHGREVALPQNLGFDHFHAS